MSAPLHIPEEEFNQLPPEAQIALGARAALRVLPVLGKEGHFNFWKEKAGDHLKNVELAIHASIFFGQSSNAREQFEYNPSLTASAATDAESADNKPAFRGSVAAVSVADAVFVAETPGRSILNALNYAETTDSRFTLFLQGAQRADFMYLTEMYASKAGADLDRFYQQPIWPEGTRPEGWAKIESNFQSALQSISYPELYKRYEAGGAVYTTLKVPQPEKEKKDFGEKVGDFVEEQIAKVVGGASRFVKKNIFSIVSHSVKPALDVERHADIMAQLLKNFRYERGQFVGIFGQWGRGKTFFWEQVKKIIVNDARPPFEMVEFQAWKYQDTPASWAYLYEILANHYIKCKHLPILLRPLVGRWRTLKLNMVRGIWKKPLYTFVFVSIIGYVGIIATNMLASIQDELTRLTTVNPFYVITGSFALPSLLVLFIEKMRKNFSTKAIDLYEKMTKKVSFNGLLGTQAEIQKELIVLLKAWFPDPEKKRLLLFVDDIDRCEEEKIIQIVDALRVMLEEPNLVKRMIVIAAVDERILKRAIIKKYDKLVDEKWFDEESYKEYINTLTREYMDKLFITGIKLMQLSQEQMESFFEKLTADDQETDRIVVNPEDIFEEQEALPEEEEEKQETPKKQDISDGGEKPPAEKPPAKGEAQPEIQLEALDSTSQFELEKFEQAILKDAVAQMPDATPRQIRIWYYRYLLAMRLLEPLLEQYKNPEKLKQISRLVARLLLVYGLLYSLEELEKKLPGYKKGRKTVSVNHKELKFSETIEPEISSKIFEVLEMVIAY